MSFVVGQPTEGFRLHKGRPEGRPDIATLVPVVRDGINIYAAIVIGFDWYDHDGREQELLRVSVWTDRTSPNPTEVVNVLSGYTRLAAGHYMKTADLS